MDKLRFSKKVVVSAVCAVVGYTLIALVFAWFEKVIPVELTVGWFSFWGVEVVALMRLTLEEKRCECQEGNNE